MKQLCENIQEKEKELHDLLNYFTPDQIRTSPDYNTMRLIIKSLSVLYSEQEEKIYSHFKTK